MFGIGGTELIVIAVVLLIAVGPSRLPKLIKTAVKGYREFRKATRDLRASTGIDDILKDEDLRDLRELRELNKPLYAPPAKKGVAPARAAASKPAEGEKPEAMAVLTEAEREREMPAEGVDVAEIRYALEAPDEAASEKIRAAKEATMTGEDAQRVIAAKEAEARAGDDIIAAKLAAAEDAGYGEVGGYEPPERTEEEQRIVDAKLAVTTPGEHAEAWEDDPIVAAKLAAAAEERGLDDEQVAQSDDPIVRAKIAAASRE